MKNKERLRIAIQKSGRLSEKTISLFSKCGLTFDLRKDRLIHSAADFPIDLMLVRDDDIPQYVLDGVCDLGIVGENVLREKSLAFLEKKQSTIENLQKLGFGNCRLSIAVPQNFEYVSAQSLNGLKIATSYPSCLKQFLNLNNVNAEILELGGSVEIAPILKIADAICDLVSTGNTLLSNGLKEVDSVFQSQACLIQTNKKLSAFKNESINRLVQRIQGVLKASQTKYIMMNADKSSLSQIKSLLPGLEEPSVIPIGLDGKRVAIHAVAEENVFWETIENLKKAGASSILVLSIEKVIS